LIVRRLQPGVNRHSKRLAFEAPPESVHFKPEAAHSIPQAY